MVADSGRRPDIVRELVGKHSVSPEFRLVVLSRENQDGPPLSRDDARASRFASYPTRPRGASDWQTRKRSFTSGPPAGHQRKSTTAPPPSPRCSEFASNCSIPNPARSKTWSWNSNPEVPNSPIKVQRQRPGQGVCAGRKLELASPVDFLPNHQRIAPK